MRSGFMVYAVTVGSAVVTVTPIDRMDGRRHYVRQDGAMALLRHIHGVHNVDSQGVETLTLARAVTARDLSSGWMARHIYARPAGIAEQLVRHDAAARHIRTCKAGLADAEV